MISNKSHGTDTRDATQSQVTGSFAGGGATDSTGEITCAEPADDQVSAPLQGWRAALRATRFGQGLRATSRARGERVDVREGVGTLTATKSARTLTAEMLSGELSRNCSLVNGNIIDRRDVEGDDRMSSEGGTHLVEFTASSDGDVRDTFTSNTGSVLADEMRCALENLTEHDAAAFLRERGMIDDQGNFVGNLLADF